MVKFLHFNNISNYKIFPGNYFPMEEFIFADTALNNTMIVDDLIRNLDIQTNTVAILFL